MNAGGFETRVARPSDVDEIPLAHPDSICSISSSRLAVAAAAKSGRIVVSGGV